jgi:hypothetical protein
MPKPISYCTGRTVSLGCIRKPRASEVSPRYYLRGIDTAGLVMPDTESTTGTSAPSSATVPGQSPWQGEQRSMGHT